MAGTAGWFRSERMEALRAQWLSAPDLAGQQALARDMQGAGLGGGTVPAAGRVPQPTAYRTGITGVLNGTAVFWNVRPA